jgi:hypothetical protein
MAQITISLGRFKADLKWESKEPAYKPTYVEKSWALWQRFLIWFAKKVKRYRNLDDLSTENIIQLMQKARAEHWTSDKHFTAVVKPTDPSDDWRYPIKIIDRLKYPDTKRLLEPRSRLDAMTTEELKDYLEKLEAIPDSKIEPETNPTAAAGLQQGE